MDARVSFVCLLLVVVVLYARMDKVSAESLNTK